MSSRRIVSLLSLLSLLAYAALCLFAWTETRWRPEWDSGIYLLAGQSIALGEGYRYLGEPFFLRPPGFSWLLSWFTDGGLYGGRTLSRIVMSCTALSVAAIWAALRGRIGDARAIAVAWLAGSSALFTHVFNWVVPEYAFLAVLFASLGLLDHSARSRDRWWLTAAAGAVLLGVAAHLRTVAVVMVPVLAVLPFLQRSSQPVWRAALPALLAAAVVLPWILYAGSLAGAAPVPSEQLYLFDYATATLHVDPGNPASAYISFADLMGRLSANGQRLLRDLAKLLFFSHALAAQLAAAAAVLVGFGVAVRRDLSVFDGFAVVYTGVLLTYFTYDSRLALPLAPLAYLYAFRAVSLLVNGLAGRVPEGRARELLAPVSLCVVFVALLGVNLSFASPTGPARDRRFPELARWFRQNTPEDAVILAHRAPVLGYLSGRRTYTYDFQRAPDLLARHGIDYVVLYSDSPKGLVRLTESRAIGAWSVAGRVVYRVRPSGSVQSR